MMIGGYAVIVFGLRNAVVELVETNRTATASNLPNLLIPMILFAVA